MRLMATRFVAATLVALAVVFPSTAFAQRCDLTCLADFITQYLDAMKAHNPELLHTSSRVRFTASRCRASDDASGVTE